MNGKNTEAARSELASFLERAENHAIELLAVIHKARGMLSSIADLDTDNTKGEFDELDDLLTDDVRTNVLGLHENVESFLRLFWGDGDPWNSNGGD